MGIGELSQREGSIAKSRLVEREWAAQLSHFLFKGWRSGGSYTGKEERAFVGIRASS